MNPGPFGEEPMPIYTYECQKCRSSFDEERAYGERLNPTVCDCGGEASYRISAVAIGASRPRGAIMDARELPPRWRDEGTTGREGGAGRVQTFDQGAK